MLEVHVDGVNGSDITGDGTEELPLRTMAHGVTYLTNNSKMIVYPASYIEAISIDDVALTSNIHIEGRGGSKPRIDGFVRYTSFTLDSGNIWQTTSLVDPKNVYFETASGLVKGTKVANKASIVSAYQWWYNGTTTIFMYSTADPSSNYVSVRGNSISAGFYVEGINNFSIKNFEIMGIKGSGVNFVSCSNATVQNSTASYCSEDGMGGTDCTNVLIENCLIEWNGEVRGVIASPGDGISFHGTSTGVIRKNIVRNNMKAGIDNVQNSSFIIEHNLVYNNFANILSYSNIDAGVWTIIRNNIILSYSTDFGACGVNSNTVIYNNTMIGTHFAATMYGILFDSAGAYIAIVKNNIITRFTNGMNNLLISGAVIAETYNTIYDCSGGNTSGFALHSTDSTTDAQLVDIANGDYRLSTASTSRKRCENLTNYAAGQTSLIVEPNLDYAGNLRPAVGDWDAGALQYASRTNPYLLSMINGDF